jgi:hypothetical protein
LCDGETVEMLTPPSLRSREACSQKTLSNEPSPEGNGSLTTIEQPASWAIKAAERSALKKACDHQQNGAKRPPHRDCKVVDCAGPHSGCGPKNIFPQLDKKWMVFIQPIKQRLLQQYFGGVGHRTSRSRKLEATTVLGICK